MQKHGVPEAPESPLRVLPNYPYPPLCEGNPVMAHHAPYLLTVVEESNDVGSEAHLYGGEQF